MVLDAATAGLIGAAIVLLGNALVTWITKHFDERKAYRELLIKTAWDHWTTAWDRGVQRGEGGRLAPFEVYLFHTLKLIELTERKNLSKEQIVTEYRKICELTDAITTEIKSGR